jgi:hypothetical protein
MLPWLKKYFYNLHHSLSRYDGLEPQQTSKTELYPTGPPHHAQILCLSFIKYHSSWLHVSSQLSLLDDYFIIRKYNELNHRDRAQINKLRLHTITSV